MDIDAQMKRAADNEVFAIYLTDGMAYDQLHKIANEYSQPVELLADLAVRRFVNDVELFRKLRFGNAKTL